MAVQLIATLTNTARQREAQGTVTGKSFKIVSFEVGTEGHDPSDPLVALPPDPTINELPGRVFGPEPVDNLGYLSPTCPYWELTIEDGEANGTLISSIALIAEIVSNGDDAVDEVGTTFIYAVAHFPRVPKVPGDTFEYLVGIQVG